MKIKRNILPVFARIILILLCLGCASLTANATVATPVFTPDTGTSITVFNVMVTCSTSGAVIHYTTNGNAPTTSDPIIASGGTIYVGRNLILSAQAWNGADTSAIKSGTYTVCGGIAAGTQHALVVKSDENSVWAWGGNANGQIGDGTTTTRLTPVRTLLSAGVNLTGIIAVAAGGYHSLALKSNNTVVAWGDNAYGELGNGTKADQSYPVNVLLTSGGNLSGIIDIKCGGNHSIALKSDKTVWSWGCASSGQLGIGSSSATTSAAQVKTNSSTYLQNIVGIASGDSYNIAVDGTGRVWSWGGNAYGQLGNGTTTNGSYATQLSASSISNVIEVAAGFKTALALKNDGTVWAWGYNAYGGCGNGNTVTPQKTPVQVMQSGTVLTPLTHVVMIAAGSAHCAAVKDDGSLWMWGNDNAGDLGVGNPPQYPSRTSAVQVMTRAVRR